MAYEKSDGPVQKKSKTVRLTVLVLILIFSTFLGITHIYPLAGWTPPPIDSFCPFGGIESAFSLIFTGKMLQRIAWSSFVLLLATLIVALLFRRSFCGNICPLGTLQELFARLGKKIFGKTYQVSSKIDKSARYLKYVALVIFVLLTWKAGTMVIRPYDPWVAYHHLASSDLFPDSTIGFIVLVLSFIGSLAYDRVFCKYLCPMGGFLALLYRVGRFRVRRNETTCIHCKKCDQVCPVNIPVESGVDVTSAECINCNECVNACPVKDTLFVSGPKNTKIKPSSVLWITLAIFVVVTGIASFSGGFEWKMQKLEEKIIQTGLFNPDAITGRDTFSGVAEASKISKDLFLKRFKISEEEFNKPIRDVAHKPNSGFETEDVRKFVHEQMKSK
jgi:polyferredoxin